MTVAITAFFPHVQSDLARAAQEAGCDQVMARSYLSAHLPEILVAVASKPKR